MSNYWLCDACGNFNHRTSDGLVDCRTFAFPVDPIAAIDLGSRYVYVDEFDKEFDEPEDACAWYAGRDHGRGS